MAELISYEAARELIEAQARSFGHEMVDLDEAEGRVLAQTVYADRDYPPFNRAAMDGFAFRLADWEAGIREYQVQEIIYAGQVCQEQLARESCYKIMTGAAVPSSADALIRREDSQESGDKVVLTAKAMKAFLNIARQGEDLQKGQVAFRSGQWIDATVIGALAALGQEKVLVERLPKVALFTTGDEVMPLGKSVSNVQIRNSNLHLLKVLLRKWNIRPTTSAHLADNLEELSLGLQNSLASDIIILSGGVSAGDADYVPEVLKSLGVKQQFHKVAIKPGKPVFFGTLPDGGVVFGLPGNPLSCLITFTVFIGPFLRRSFGLKGKGVYQLPLLQAKAKKHALTEFFTVRLQENLAGIFPLGHTGSGDIRTGMNGHGLGIHPAAQETLSFGESVGFIPFGPGFQ